MPIAHEFPAWGVDVFESHHADDWRMDLTRHPFLKLVFVLDGAGAFVPAEGRRASLVRGDLVVVPMGVEHRLEDAPGKPMSLYVVSVKSEILRVARVDEASLASGKLDLDAVTSSHVEAMIRRLRFEQTLDPPVAGAKVVGLALRLIGELVHFGRRPPTEGGVQPRRATARDSAERVRSYVDELHDGFFETSNLDAVAAGLGLSRRRFTQLFREITGSSWLAYVRRLRVDHARHLLSQTDRTVLSIAFECGFEDLSTFYRAFKREVGQSPNRWRSSPTDGRNASRT